jgi:6-phosphogluconolactonase
VTLQLEVLDDPSATCAELLLEAAAGGGQIVLTGGSTPRSAYERAAEDAAAWGGATVWFSDERCVPVDDERSNYKMVKEALLDRLSDGASVPTVHRIEGELGPFEAAEAYEHELRDAGPPRFDLVLLGIGPDGHIASLFPDHSALDERSRLVVGVPEAGLEPHVPRVSLTLPAIAAGERIVCLVCGASKADAVAAAFGPGAAPDPHVPSSLLPALVGDLEVLLDPAAAARL